MRRKQFDTLACAYTYIHIYIDIYTFSHSLIHIYIHTLPHGGHFTPSMRRSVAVASATVSNFI